MKEKLLLILNKFLNFSDLIFIKINKFFNFLFKNLIANFSNFFIGLVFLIGLVFYQAIVEILNFEIMGKEFTFGDSLNNLFSLGFEATWNLLITSIRSLYLIGLYRYIYYLIKPLIESRKNQKQLIIEDEISILNNEDTETE